MAGRSSDDAKRAAAELLGSESSRCAAQHKKAQDLADAGNPEAAEIAYGKADAMRAELRTIEDALGD